MTDVVPERTFCFVKLGGSLITDKTRAYTPRSSIIARLAREVREALDADEGLQLLLGHGSGSFGHWAAEPYGTRRGVRTPEQWRGYAEVAAAAGRLNRIVTDAFLEAGVPVLSLQPSASARCRDGALVAMALRPVREALAHDLVPLVYGDVALDDVRGGTIVSTEELFVYLADALRPDRILLLGEVPGVLGGAGEVIARIAPPDLPELRDVLAGSEAVDVTGGMVDKVERMVALIRRHPTLRARILTGMEPGLLTRVLLDADLSVGTRITAGQEQDKG